MLITILDGYVDEPSRLGVPPFISPYPRYIAGALASVECDCQYLTIDHWRSGRRPEGQLLFIISGAMVPGRYLRSMPMSERELSGILPDFHGEKIVWSPSARIKGRTASASGTTFIDGCDPDTYIFDLLTSGKPTDRRREPEEWRDWAIAGAPMIDQHQDFPQPLIAEVDVSYGCPRYLNGGCSFCTEPLYGEPVFRDQADIINEVKALLKAGCTNFRLGGQSCILSYKAEGIGETDAPRPNVAELTGLLKPLSKLEGIGVLHTDNANPAVLARYPEESGKCLDAITRTCTGGNVLSLGMESADPTVIEKNNLNASPEEVLAAIKLINRIGQGQGHTGLPILLPGLNFLAGLEGETRETFQKNAHFLRDVLNAHHTLRRINIRQVAPTRRNFPRQKHRKEFMRFKRFVREEIDPVMLERVVPAGTVLKDVYTELKKGRLTFARQIGTYPLLVGIPQDLELGSFLNVAITGHGSRSVTGVEHPLNVNDCQMSALEALPGIGRKRAARLVRARPIGSAEELERALDEPEPAGKIIKYLVFEGET